jgi:hypothetical protein
MNKNDKILLSKGIGKLYHNKALADYNADDVIEFVKDKNHFAVGKGANFFGVTANSYDVAILAARAVILTDVVPKLHVLHFSYACDNELINQLWQETPPILITMFNPDSRFVSGEKYLRLENILSYYLDHAIPIFLHFPVANVEATGNLINPVFLDRAIKINKNFELE